MYLISLANKNDLILKAKLSSVFRAQFLRGKLKLGLFDLSRWCFHFYEKKKKRKKKKKKKKSLMERLGIHLTSLLTGGCKGVKILLCGKTGVGKSSLVNALIGQKIAAEGHSLNPETTEVSY